MKKLKNTLRGMEYQRLKNHIKVNDYQQTYDPGNVRLTRETLAILDDPEIDCVLVALPNSLHYEWSARAIKAGKHVLIEKPSCATAREAEKLFNMPELSQPGGPVILEMLHNRFHPAWQFFCPILVQKMSFTWTVL